ncbi:MAG TPA: sigma-70 family RNA polymerase sigma factor [Fimbriiglobus sp.]|jgi:RNA polymerase sigma-70 factor (ECF subfamily)
MFSEATDAELITRYRAGEGTAFGALLDRYEGPVFRFLFGMLRDHHCAEDALQETFVQALRRVESVEPATFRGWLFTVAHRQAVLQKRKDRRVPTPADLPALLGLATAGDGPEAEATRADAADAVRGLLGRLPAPQQAVIRLRLFDGLRFREVAEQLGCPINTALARMHDGVKALRAMWEERNV